MDIVLSKNGVKFAIFKIYDAQNLFKDIMQYLDHRKYILLIFRFYSRIAMNLAF